LVEVILSKHLPKLFEGGNYTEELFKSLLALGISFGEADVEVEELQYFLHKLDFVHVPWPPSALRSCTQNSYDSQLSQIRTVFAQLDHSGVEEEG
jgi:hypothetical protein